MSFPKQCVSLVYCSSHWALSHHSCCLLPFPRWVRQWSNLRQALEFWSKLRSPPKINGCFSSIEERRHGQWWPFRSVTFPPPLYSIPYPGLFSPLATRALNIITQKLTASNDFQLQVTGMRIFFLIAIEKLYIKQATEKAGDIEDGNCTYVQRHKFRTPAIVLWSENWEFMVF